MARVEISMTDQEYIPGERSTSASIRQQLLETLKARGVEGGIIPQSLALRIDAGAYPGKRLDLDGIKLWVKS